MIKTRNRCISGSLWKLYLSYSFKVKPCKTMVKPLLNMLYTRVKCMRTHPCWQHLHVLHLSHFLVSNQLSWYLGVAGSVMGPGKWGSCHNCSHLTHGTASLIITGDISKLLLVKLPTFAGKKRLFLLRPSKNPTWLGGYTGGYLHWLSHHFWWHKSSRNRTKTIVLRLIHQFFIRWFNIYICIYISYVYNISPHFFIHHGLSTCLP